VPKKYRFEFDLICHDRKRLIDAAVEHELDNRKHAPAMSDGVRRGIVHLDDGDTPVPSEELHNWFDKNFNEAISIVASEYMDDFFDKWSCCEPIMFNVREVSDVEAA
jgi:hypothetical protein